jgi:hypothetical protein
LKFINLSYFHYFNKLIKIILVLVLKQKEANAF